MGYAKIPNLERNADILMFKEVYALEKIHGTSTHVSHDSAGLHFFGGGVYPHDAFITLFDQSALTARFQALRAEHSIPAEDRITVYGEGYGGKMQGFSHTYGKQLKFIAFDVKVADKWLNVPNAHSVATALGFEFVHFERVIADLAGLTRLRDSPSVQALRNGIAEPKPREGIVLRPPFEVRTNDGGRVCAKYVAEAFRETKSVRKVRDLDAEKLKALEDAKAIADEYVVPMRLNHVLGKLTPPATSIKDTGRVIAALVEDVKVEAGEEVVWSPEAARAVGQAAALLYKKHLNVLAANA